MSKIVLDSILESISTRMDGTMSIKLGTNEIDSSNAASLFQLRGKYCKVLLSDTNITALEEELVDKAQIAATKKNKTPSQRLRSCIYVFCEQQGIDFDDNYNRMMNEFIETVKSKLE